LAQAGAVVVVTFRAKDSIPAEVINRWHREKVDWLRSNGVDCEVGLEAAKDRLRVKDRLAFYKHFRRVREVFLDTCHGRCLLRRADLAKIVADSFLHFDGERNRMGDFIIMPNHVHLLAVFFEEEPFDHLVRSPEQYEYLRAYIADNPKKARLKLGEYLYRRFN
jgi:type I restriction enzyme R subunit